MSNPPDPREDRTATYTAVEAAWFQGGTEAPPRPRRAPTEPPAPRPMWWRQLLDEIDHGEPGAPRR